eukprot:TRINITY_DN1777_c0_g1_i1.p1 TRINITY_DN1777_c0_g1~~TRINITY_DN1777_c0_g1_i1.p1  ORF type:complete len:133 (-),score=11.71 TRINITY_DN1777_c0_g1_i1:14-412(-)
MGLKDSLSPSVSITMRGSNTGPQTTGPKTASCGGKNPFTGRVKEKREKWTKRRGGKRKKTINTTIQLNIKKVNKTMALMGKERRKGMVGLLISSVYGGTREIKKMFLKKKKAGGRNNGILWFFFFFFLLTSF